MMLLKLMAVRGLGIKMTLNSQLTVYGLSVIFVMILHAVHGSSSSSFKESIMFQTPLCDMDQRITLGCVRLETGIRDNGLLPCLLMCNLENTCVGGSIDEEGKCYLHKECPALLGTCSVSNENYKHMHKNCDNGGTWLTGENRCQCVNGTFGERCQSHPKRCQDLETNGYGKGSYTVYLDIFGNGLDLYRARCGVSPSSTKLLVFRSQGKENFNRTWNEYRDGFEIDNRNYWIGLERLYKLYNLTEFRLLMFIKSSSGRASRSYFGFRLTDENDGYRLNFDSSMNTSTGILKSSNVIGDCLGEVKDTPFSSWDRANNGQVGENCASVFGSGWWWMSDCSNKCNLFGYLPRGGSSTYPPQQLVKVEGVTIGQNNEEGWIELGMHFRNAL